MRLEITKKTNSRIQTDFLSLLAKKISRAYKLHDQKISVVFVGEREMRKLSFIYKGAKQACDVLSFTYNDSDLRGEIIICYQVARRQAQHDGLSLAEQIRKLFVHGCLHILGFSHQTPTAARRMMRQEQAVLQ
jgi:probable rRNA maturation factor